MNAIDLSFGSFYVIRSINTGNIVVKTITNAYHLIDIGSITTTNSITVTSGETATFITIQGGTYIDWLRM